LSCWHAYNSNPAIIKLHISKDGKSFFHWQTIQTKLEAGKQIFKLRERVKSDDVNYLKLEVLKTHGAAADGQTYIN
jgi:hypothetical protein